MTDLMDAAVPPAHASTERRTDDRPAHAGAFRVTPEAIGQLRRLARRVSGRAPTPDGGMLPARIDRGATGRYVLNFAATAEPGDRVVVVGGVALALGRGVDGDVLAYGPFQMGGDFLMLGHGDDLEHAELVVPAPDQPACRLFASASGCDGGGCTGQCATAFG